MNHVPLNLRSTLSPRSRIDTKKDAHGERSSESALGELLSSCFTSGDELLWTEFIRLTQPMIAGVVVRRLRQWTRPIPGLVDDLVQETYAKLFVAEAGALRRFIPKHENALHGFLKKVAANIVQDHCRRCFTQKRGGGQIEESIDAISDNSRGIINTPLERNNAIVEPSERLAHHIIMREIDSHLKRRGATPGFLRDYKIFWLHYRDGLTATAIARIPSIGLTVKGVESSLWRLTRSVRLKMR